MEETRLDAFAKTLARSPSRRSALLLLGAAGIGLGLGVPGWLIPGEADTAIARKNCRKLKDKKRRQACLEKSGKHGKNDKKGKKRKKDRKDKPGSQAPAVSPLCSESSCPPGLVCDARRGCVCASGTKTCNDACVPFGTCCGGCPENAVCVDGRCRAQDLSLYPDLRALPPSELQFDVVADDLHVLRFSNTIWNAGDGRLELEGDADPDGAEEIYQNLYDDPIAGNLTSHEQIASDFIFHDNHNHFHFADFASYRLLTKDANGVYQPSTQESTKISFCIMDTDDVLGIYDDLYTRCGRDWQGLTPGWGDTYRYNLPDQWVVLGDAFLDDGEYGLESTADPKNLLNEGDPNLRSNNTATTYFTIFEGEIEGVRHTAVHATKGGE